jgi:hypothetical protein
LNHHFPKPHMSLHNNTFTHTISWANPIACKTNTKTNSTVFHLRKPSINTSYPQLKHSSTILQILRAKLEGFKCLSLNFWSGVRGAS